MEKEEPTLFILVLTVICLFITKLLAAGSTESRFGFEMEIQFLCAWKEVHTLHNSQFLSLEHWLNFGKISKTINLWAKMNWNLKRELVELWQTYGRQIEIA